MDESQADLNMLLQIANDICTISFETWRHLRSKGYVEAEIENTPEGVYAKLSERGAKLLRQANQSTGDGGRDFKQVDESMVAMNQANIAYIQRLQVENGRLRRALENIIKVAPSSQPIPFSFDKGDADDRQDYGYSLGLWEASRIAREALSAQKS